MKPARYPAPQLLVFLLLGVTVVVDSFAANVATNSLAANAITNSLAANAVTNSPATNAVTNSPAMKANELLRQDSDLMATAIKMFGAFSIVLAVFGGFVLVVKKWGHLSPHTHTNRELNVIEFRVLAHKTYLYVVEHQKNRFLISVGPNGTTLISPPSTPSFAANLPFPAEELALETHPSTP